MLPSVDDDVTNVTSLARMLCKYVPFFKHTYDGVLERHIEHRYYKQMSSNLEVVRYKLCIFLCIPLIYTETGATWSTFKE